MPEVLHTDLVSLEPIGLEEIADMLADPALEPGRRHVDWHPDYPREDDCDGVRLVREVGEWSSRKIRRVSTGLVVGSIGFFGPPAPAADGVPEAEVGYGLVAAARGQGLMGSALPALLKVADAAGVRVRAHTEPGNAASRTVLRRNGFSQEPGLDDGEELWVRRWE